MSRSFALAAVLVLMASPQTRGDWEVKRRGPEALIGQALGALEANPDQPALAARIVRWAGKTGVGDALERLGRAAEQTGRYEPRAALAQLLLASGRGAESADAFAQALALRPAAVAAAVGRARALALAGPGHENEALDAYAAAAALQPSSTALLKETAALAHRLGAIEPELSAWRALADLAPKDVASAVALADALGRAGRPAEGASVLEDRLRQPGLSLPRRNQLARRAATLWEAAGDDEAAERRLREIAMGAAHGERAQDFRRLLEISLRRDSLPDLERQIAAALERDGSGRRIGWEALADVREMLGDFEGALAALRRAAAQDSTNMAHQQRILVLLGRLGRDDERAEIYDEIGRRWPPESAVALERIERAFSEGDRDLARVLFDRALRILRRDQEALAKLADLASRWSEDDRVLAAWDAVLALDPRDSRAIVGLGEAHFQRGRRELALGTWRGLLGAVKPPAEAHARLAELLGERNLLEEATAEVRSAQRLAPQNPRHYRTLARILERKKDSAGAVVAWRTALAMSGGPDRGPERREARSSLLALMAREGRGRLDLEAVRLAHEVERNPEDRETRLFLAEVELRRMDPDRALATLRAAAARWPGDAEIVAPLVRLLRQSRQMGEAVARLEALVEAAPARAREVYLQIADIELGRYADDRALLYADKARALATDDPEALARVGLVEERAGRQEQAISVYRRALVVGPAPRAAMALESALVRQGETAEVSRTLRALARSTTDEEARTELLRTEIEVSELRGKLPELEPLLWELAGRGESFRELTHGFLRRRVPPLYERAMAGDGVAAEALARLSRWGLRPLLELATDPGAEAKVGLIELLGMLGNRHATPVLVRLVEDRARKPAASGARSSGVPVAAAVALGRLRDPRAAEALLALADSPDTSVRVVALWALGRLPAAGLADLFERAARDPVPEVAAVACLGLGRLKTAGSGRGLLQRLQEADTRLPVRRAAALALGLAAEEVAAPALVSLLEHETPALAEAAAAALGAIKDRRTLPDIWDRALLGRGPTAAAARRALSAFAGARGLPDEAGVPRDARFEVNRILDALARPPTALEGAAGEELEALFIESANHLTTLLAHALALPGERRARALEALDGQEDGIGFGFGFFLGDHPPSSAARAALRRMGVALRDGVALALDDPEPAIRRRALRVASAVGDPRVTLPHIQAILAEGRSGGSAREDDLAEAESTARVVASKQLASGRLDPDAFAQALRPMTADGHWARRLVAFRLLRLVGPHAEEAFIGALGDASAFVRAEAAMALGGNPRAAPVLRRALGDPSATVRAAARRGLAPAAPRY